MHRTYVRRRVVATAVAALAVFGAGAVVRGATRGPAMNQVSQRSYVVRSGDTLWAVASRLRPSGDPRPLIQAIERANGIGAGDLVPGRRLLIPADA